MSGDIETYAAAVAQRRDAQADIRSFRYLQHAEAARDAARGKDPEAWLQRLRVVKGMLDAEVAAAEAEIAAAAAVPESAGAGADEPAQ